MFWLLGPLGFTPVRQGAGKWLAEVVDLFEADIRTYESIMVNWRSKEEIEAGRETDGDRSAFVT